MSGKMRVVAIILACGVLLGIFGALGAAAEGNVYFTAAADELRPLSDDTMPFVRSGEYYLPYTIFSEKSLGISYSRDLSKYTLTLSDGSKTLVFDSLRGYAYDEQQRYDERLAARNGTVYLPIEFVCDYFGLDFQVIATKPVPILRVAGSGSMSQSEFRQKVEVGLAQLYLEYQTAGEDDPSPSATGSTAPSPTPSGGEVDSSPEPTPEQPEEEPVTVYLTFDDGPNVHTTDILNVLDDYDVKAAFFLTGSLLESEDRQDIVRRIVGSGHTVGIHAYSHVPEQMYASVESLTGELERANEALRAITGERTRLFRFPYGSRYTAVTKNMREAVIGAGYRYWDWTVDAEDYTQPSAAALASQVISGLRAAKPGSTAVVLMHDTGYTAQALETILDYIEAGNFVIETIQVTTDPINFGGDLR